MNQRLKIKIIDNILAIYKNNDRQYVSQFIYC